MFHPGSSSPLLSLLPRPLRTGVLGSLPGGSPEERRGRRGPELPAAGLHVGRLPVARQDDNAALLLGSGAGDADAADRPGGPAAGVGGAVRGARLRPLRAPRDGQRLQAPGAGGVRRQRGADVRADAGLQAGRRRLAQPEGAAAPGRLLRPGLQPRADTEPRLPAGQEKTLLVLRRRRGGVLNSGRRRLQHFGHVCSHFSPDELTFWRHRGKKKSLFRF